MSLERKIVEFLIPFMTDSDERKTHVELAFIGRYEGLIDYSGNARDFTVRFVRLLRRNGGKQDLIRFLEHIQGDLGVDRQQEAQALIDALIAEGEQSNRVSSPSRQSIPIIPIVILLALLGGGAILFSNINEPPLPTPTEENTATATLTETTVPTVTDIPETIVTLSSTPASPDTAEPTVTHTDIPPTTVEATPILDEDAPLVLSESGLLDAINSVRDNPTLVISADLMTTAERQMIYINSIAYSELVADSEIALVYQDTTDMTSLARNLHDYTGTVYPYFSIGQQPTLTDIVDGFAAKYGNIINTATHMGFATQESLAGGGSTYLLILLGDA